MTRRGRDHVVLAVVWFALAAAGLIGTAVFNVQWATDERGLSLGASLFGNPAMGSATVDLLVAATAASIFMVVEGGRLGWGRRAWLLVIGSFVTAIAFTFPLFLGLRELALRRRSAARVEGGDLP